MAKGREINTSYDHDKDLSETPLALYSEFSGAEPIPAKNGQGFMDIQKLEEDDYGFEKLNKDGTGVRRAPRGIDPNTTNREVLKFEYVSKSDCEICKQYDGKLFLIDDPNRPKIPRLEGWNKGDVTTHPRCKCRWAIPDPIKYTGEVDERDFARARKWFGQGFDKLTKTQQKMVIIDMLKKSIGMENEAEEFDIADPIPFASILKMIYDSTSPAVRVRLGVEYIENFEPENWTDLDMAEKKRLLRNKGFDEYQNYNANQNYEDLHPMIKDELEEAVGLDKDFDDDKGVINQAHKMMKGQKAYLDYNDDEDPEFGAVWQKGGEGGQGSGRPNHKPWMTGAELGEECPHCMVYTAIKNNICELCGNRVK